MEPLDQDMAQFIKEQNTLRNQKPKFVDIKQEVNRISSLDTMEETQEALDQLNAITPTWFFAYIEEKGKKYLIKKAFNHEKMGDMLISKYKLVKYPKLIEGAVYEASKGIWRYFGKREMDIFVGNETISELKRWNFYERDQYVNQTIRYVSNMSYDKSYPSVTPCETSKPELVAFRNGTYNLLTDEMYNHSPDYHIMTFHDYDLNMSGKENPHTNALLDGMVGENAIFLKQFIGYMFYRSYSPAQEMVFFKGEGGEGKSSLLNFITKYLVGSENASAITPQDLSNDKFLSAELLGKSINVSADISDNYIKDTSLLKRITGGDFFTAQYKGIQGFTMTNYAKQIFSANSLPRFSDLSGGFGARLVVLPFINGNQRDKDAIFWKDHDMNKIEQEAPSFTYECIREFRKIFNGKKATFTKPKSMQEAIQKWLYENDHIGEFLTEYTNINLVDHRGEIATTVYDEYTKFCAVNKYLAKSSQAFKSYLEKKGITKKRTTQGYGADGGTNQWRYIGLELIRPSLNN